MHRLFKASGYAPEQVTTAGLELPSRLKADTICVALL
jgi:hypothetical protein